MRLPRLLPLSHGWLDKITSSLTLLTERATLSKLSKVLRIYLSRNLKLSIIHLIF